MTKTNPYFDALMRARRDAENVLPGMEELTQFCAAIKQYIGGGGHVECSPVPGMLSSTYGQEYKVILTFVPSAYTQTLVRAYLNLKGKPHLDVLDGKGPRKCKDVTELAQKLKAYLAVPTVVATLDTFRRDAEARRLVE